MNIIEGDFQNVQVLKLLRLHLDDMNAHTPPDATAYAQDLAGLDAPDVSFYTVWKGATLLGMGALKELDARSGEVKSMRTDPAHVRKGAAAALLEHVIAVSRARGYQTLSLETGSGKIFEPALSLYRKFRFVNGPVFGDYEQSSFNQFLHLDL